MHDIKYIRDHPDAFDALFVRRGLAPVAAEIIAMDQQYRRVTTEIQTAQARRNAASRDIGRARASGDDDLAQSLMAEVAALKKRMAELEEEESAASQTLHDFLSGLPNLVYGDVAEGVDESDNELLRSHGVKRVFDFDPKEHFEIGEYMGLMDFERAAKLSGSRFVVLRGALARLERALGQFMLDLHVNEHDMTEMWTPVLVRDEALYGTSQLPKFAGDSFVTTNGYWLIPTSEVSLTNLHAGEILDEASLPIRYCAHTQCFRSEAGAAGRDTRGMIRQHQFEKVEMVAITRPEESDAELERMTQCAETVLKRLNLPYRVMKLCAGDIGFAARRTYDLEVWLPGQAVYREISSCSVVGDFQARRMKMRCRLRGEKQTRFPHTLNGSGLAVGRTLIAVLENYQNADGSVTVPDALIPYMGGQKLIAKSETL